MENYKLFRSPQLTVYGRDSFNRVGSETALRGKRALLVSDGIMESLGYLDQCVRFLKEENIECVTYIGVKSEPNDKYVDEALTIFEENNCDVILSLGGGSCIDTAKAVAVVATNGGYIGDYMGGKKMATNPSVPHIAIPTTAGTGSEATDVTVITNLSNDEKMMIKQPAFMPAVAIVDPLFNDIFPG